MKRPLTATLMILAACLFATGQKTSEPSALQTSQDMRVMLAAVSRDTSMLSGGIGTGESTGRGTVVVEPLALLTPSGEWIEVPCTSGKGQGCLKFQREYLKYPHEYTVISTDGKGAIIHAKPTSLSECFDYTGTGTYSGASITTSAIAASSPDLFAESEHLRLLSERENVVVRKSLASLVPNKLDSTNGLRIFSLRLENRDLFVIQRAFADIADPNLEKRSLIFAIGTLEKGHFRILHWKQNTEDEDQRVLGTISLKGGREFLVTVVSDPESHLFRVYGVRDGRLQLIYSGGGSSC